VKILDTTRKPMTYKISVEANCGGKIGKTRQAGAHAFQIQYHRHRRLEMTIPHHVTTYCLMRYNDIYLRNFNGRLEKKVEPRVIPLLADWKSLKRRSNLKGSIDYNKSDESEERSKNFDIM
jgi:hypothetical protein